MKLYESEFCEIRWIEDGNIVHFIWKGYITSEGLRLVADKVIELVQSKKSKRYLTDATHIPAHTKEDQEWIHTYWFPNMIKSGVKKVAIIRPDKIVQKGVMNRIAQSNNTDTLQTMEFPTYEEAVKWLKS